MGLKWTSKDLSDLSRLYEFMALFNRKSAAQTIRYLTSGPSTLLENPRLVEKLDSFDPREVRRIVIGQYEVRYEIQDSTIFILRIWHTREDR